MDIQELKTYIHDNNLTEQILQSIQCHSIAYHNSSKFWSCANKDGDNKQAIVVYNNEGLPCINYTRNMFKSKRSTDLIDLVCFNLNCNFPQALNHICQEIGIDYYYDFDEDIPESFKVLKMITDMDSHSDNESDVPLTPISKHILDYYKPYVNDFFKNDGIDYDTQREFDIGYDESTNRITIPIYSELGDLVGVKGRLFKEELDEHDLKYLYLEPTCRSKILYGLNKTISHIQRTGIVYVLESEKAVMQLWSYGYFNAVGTGGKELSNVQIDMLTRLGAKIVFAFDKDVTKTEIEELSDRFIDGISLYYVYDENNILDEKESPSDNNQKWEQLVKHNVYKIR